MTAESTLLCSVYSRSLGEPLFATAPRTDFWILLEYPYAFGSKALEESDLPIQIKEHLTRIQKYFTNSRLLLIKKRHTGLDGKIRLFIAYALEKAPRLYRFELASYGDLLDIDPGELSRGDDSGFEAQRTDEQLLLICTNGKRDRCCAKNGLPLYEAISKIDPENTWQSSHVGGHRFSPNLVLLPYGIYFGRIPLDEASRFYDAAQHGQLIVRHYRGRACYPPEVQAAEYYLRDRTGYEDIQGIEMVESIPLKENHWQVEFRSDNGMIYQVLVSSELSDYSVIESCSLPEKRTQQWIYHLTRLHGSLISTS